MSRQAIVLLAALAMSMAARAQAPTEELSREALRDSLAQATETLAYHPDSIDLRLKKAAWNIQLKQWDYAKDDLDKVLFLDNQNIAGLFYRAYVNEQLHRYNFARQDYTNLLTLVPGNFEAQLGLALLNQKDRHFTEAYDGINRLVQQFPDKAEAYAARAGIEKERGMLELAEMDFTEAIRLDPENTDYRLNRADLRITLGRHDDARQDLKELERRGIPFSAMRHLYKRMKE